MADRTNRPCPPGQVRPTPQSRCQPRPFITTPTGGPASGLWPQGSARPAPAAPAPSPAPSCVAASIFSDCFGSCVGVINGGAPGPVCGWTFIEPFGALGGQFTFTPGQMALETFDADDFPIATKPIPAPPAGILGISGQFSFTEHQTPPNATTTYQLLVANFDLSQVLAVSLFGDGSVIVQAGDPNLIPTYLGTWTPNLGTHTVHFAVDGAGVPTLFIDGVAIPLTFVADLGSFWTVYPAGAITYGGGAGDVAASTQIIHNIFVTAGATPPQTVFCCP